MDFKKNIEMAKKENEIKIFLNEFIAFKSKEGIEQSDGSKLTIMKREDLAELSIPEFKNLFDNDLELPDFVLKIAKKELLKETVDIEPDLSNVSMEKLNKFAKHYGLEEETDTGYLSIQLEDEIKTDIIAMLDKPGKLFSANDIGDEALDLLVEIKDAYNNGEIVKGEMSNVILNLRSFSKSESLLGTNFLKGDNVFSVRIGDNKALVSGKNCFLKTEDGFKKLTRKLLGENKPLKIKDNFSVRELENQNDCNIIKTEYGFRSMVMSEIVNNEVDYDVIELLSNKDISESLEGILEFREKSELMKELRNSCDISKMFALDRASTILEKTTAPSLKNKM